MTARRLLELWEPPEGYRLASAIATTYELQADFLEEDLLPIALELRVAPARGREFRLELERALQDTEVSVFFHPGRLPAGLTTVASSGSCTLARRTIPQVAREGGASSFCDAVGARG
jgi:hypothetical protein